MRPGEFQYIDGKAGQHCAAWLHPGSETLRAMRHALQDQDRSRRAQPLNCLIPHLLHVAILKYGETEAWRG